MGRTRSLTRLGSLLRRAACEATPEASTTSSMTNAVSYVSRRGLATTPFRINVIGGTCMTEY